MREPAKYEKCAFFIYSTSQKFGHTFSFNGFCLFEFVSNTEDITTMKEHIWNYLVNKKVLRNPEYDFYFIFFKVAPFCLDDSFAHSWLLSVSFMR